MLLACLGWGLGEYWLACVAAGWAESTRGRRLAKGRGRDKNFGQGTTPSRRGDADRLGRQDNRTARARGEEQTTVVGFIDLTGKTILVTGGSRGIGEGIVRGLVREGANVVLNYTRSKNEAERIADEIGRDRCITVGAPLDDYRALEALWQKALDWKGRIDVLVNNAAVRQAIGMDAPSKEWDEHWIYALRVNLVATAHLSRLAIKHYQEKGGGIIIGITARIAVRGDRPEFFHDGASKGGMNSLMRGIARFYAKDNVLAYLVCPGMIETDQGRDFVKHYGLQEAIKEIPLGEMGKPEDIANVIVFLSSGKARYATGATIDVVGASFLH
jgi:NAD(P)-dependent dehydrogenase (short-subunit alcohol dehydrogenase family)